MIEVNSLPSLGSDPISQTAQLRKILIFKRKDPGISDSSQEGKVPSPNDLDLHLAARGLSFENGAGRHHLPFPTHLKMGFSGEMRWRNLEFSSIFCCFFFREFSIFGAVHTQLPAFEYEKQVLFCSHHPPRSSGRKPASIMTRNLQHQPKRMKRKTARVLDNQI